MRPLRRALAALETRSRQADPMSKRGGMTHLEMLHIIGSHHSHHAGQVALLRHLLGSWPPPSGSVAW